jgi:hypothetical protein
MRRATTVFAALVLTGVAATGCGGRQDQPSADSGGEITCKQRTPEWRLRPGNATAKGIRLDTARQTDPVPLHRGASRALDDLSAKLLRCRRALPQPFTAYGRYLPTPHRQARSSPR